MGKHVKTKPRGRVLRASAVAVAMPLLAVAGATGAHAAEAPSTPPTTTVAARTVVLAPAATPPSAPVVAPLPVDPPPPVDPPAPVVPPVVVPPVDPPVVVPPVDPPVVVPPVDPPVVVPPVVVPPVVPGIQPEPAAPVQVAPDRPTLTWTTIPASQEPAADPTAIPQGNAEVPAAIDAAAPVKELAYTGANDQAPLLAAGAVGTLVLGAGLMLAARRKPQQ